MKAVALDLDGFTGGGATAIGDLSDAVRRQASGKPVIAYGVGYSDDSYALASAASRSGSIHLVRAITGPGGSNLYYGLLDKLGVPPTCTASAPTNRPSSRTSATKAPRREGELHRPGPGALESWR